jgi:maltose/moltooligosaccharide transporter
MKTKTGTSNQEAGGKVKLNVGRTFLIGFGFLSTAAWSLYNVKMPLILAYYLPVISWADFLIGVIMVLDNITAIILQPYFGALSDKKKTKFGKRIPFLMIGIPSAALSFVLMPHAPNLAVLIILIMCFNLAMAFYRAPVVALMPDLTPSEVRSKGNAIINLMGGVGTISSYLIGAFLLDDDPSGATAFSVTGIIMLACLIVVMFTINEQKVTAELSSKYGPDFAADRTEIKKYRAVELSSSEKAKKQGFFDRLKNSNTVMLFREKEKSALFMLLAIFSWFMATNAVETFFSLYATSVLGFKVGSASMLLLLVSAAFIIFAIPAGFMSEKIGRRKTIKIGLILILSSVIALFFFTNFSVLLVLFLLYGVSWSMININSITVVWQLAPDGKIGAYTGIYYLFSAASAIISPVIAGFLFSIAYEAMGALRYTLLFPYAFAFLILAFFFMTRVKRGEVKMSQTEINDLKRVYEQSDE